MIFTVVEITTIEFHRNYTMKAIVVVTMVKGFVNRLFCNVTLFTKRLSCHSVIAQPCHLHY